MLPRSAATPDDHFTASPDCRVTIRAAGALVVLVAVQLSVPGLYLPPVLKEAVVSLRPRRSFHCRSRLPCDWIGQRARWWCWWLSNCPCWDCISRRCSRSRCYQLHPRRSFHCRSRLPCDRRAAGALVSAGGSPRVIGAATRGTSYYRKLVGAVHLNRLGD